MAGIRRFEDIEAWRAARELTQAIYAATREDAFSRDFPLRDQIRRAALSIMSNIAEGFARREDTEFMQFLATARGSVTQVQSHLYVALDAGHVSQDCFGRVYAQADKTASLIGGFMRYLSGPDPKATQFRPRTPTADRRTEDAR